MLLATKKVPKFVWLLGLMISGILGNLYESVALMRTALQSIAGASSGGSLNAILWVSIIICAAVIMLVAFLVIKLIFAVAIRVYYRLSFKLTGSLSAFPIYKPDFERWMYIYVIIGNLFCSLLNLGYFLAPYTYYIMQILSLAIRFACITIGFFDLKKSYIPTGMSACCYVSIMVLYVPLMFVGVI